MNNLDIIDLCSDEENRGSTTKDGRKELDSVVGTSQINGEFKGKKVRHRKFKSKSGHKKSEENRSSNAFSTNYSKVDQGGSPVNESSLSSARICRQFWKAENYEIADGQGLKVANQNGQNHLHIHPMFLHSNATSHKWVFGAIAELVDNVVDEIQNGATFVLIDEISNPRDSTPALLIQDDGGGMDPKALRCCMSFGFSDKKSKFSIGQYGNGFKTSSMRLGADVVVFSRHLEERSLTQSVGLLSYTFLRRMGYDRIVVPMVSYKFDSSTQTCEPILPHGKEHFSSNLSMLLQWSPYSTEEELLEEFDDIGYHGTKIVVYNLWLNEDGDLELDFNSDAEDICINGDQKLFQAGAYKNPIRDQCTANLYHYSLRVYLSILYMRLPQCFNIILRGIVVEKHSIASDLKFPEIILYRPKLGGNMEAEVFTTIGFLKEAPHVNTHGFNIYHRNRLILPFWTAIKNTTRSVGRGVVGVLEANFIEPTHNKQDFEKTSLFQRLEDRLKLMTLEYWEFHCEMIGYQKVKKPLPAALPSQGSLSTHSCLEQPLLLNHDSPLTDSSRTAASADRTLEDAVANTSPVSSTGLGKSAETNQARSQKDLNIKRKGKDPPVELECAKRYTGSEAYATNTCRIREEQPENSIKMATLMQENKKLHLRLFESEKREEELHLKEQQLISELENVQHEYLRMFDQLKSMDTVEKKNVNE